MILPYETIFSRALGKIDDPKELALNSNDFYEIYTERLHNVLGDARIRRLLYWTMNFKKFLLIL